MPKKAKSPHKAPIAEKPPMAAKITALRTKSGLSQQLLADKLGTHLSNVARIEAGKYKPSVEVVEKLMEIFDVTADELIRPPRKVSEKERNFDQVTAELRTLDLSPKQWGTLKTVIGAFKNDQYVLVRFAPTPIDEDALHGGKA